MQNEQITMFLQSLQGSQALIALAFLLVRRALTIEELEDLTGKDNDTVRKAVKGLSSKGLIYLQRGERGRQTWVPAGGTFFALAASQEPKTSDSGVDVVVVESEGDGGLYSTSSTNRTQNPKTSDSGGRLLSVSVLVKTEEEISATLKLLRRYGIVGEKANEIAEDHHLSDEKIEQVIRWTLAEEKWQSPAGMAIYRLLNHVEPPELRENDHAVDCSCGPCQLDDRRKYGSIADWLGKSRDEETEESEEG